MPIQTQYTPEHYVGTGLLDTYGFSWRILAKADLVAYTRDEDGVVETLELDTDYTIDDADVDTNDGGDVVLTDPLPDGTELFLVRDTTRTQLTNIEEGSPFPAAVVTKVFDRLTMMIQEANYLYRQSLHFSKASTFKDAEVPDPQEGTFLGWQDDELVNGNIGDLGEEVSVTEGEEDYQVTFDSVLANANYQVVSLTTNWNATPEWSNKLTTGFLVTFSNPAPAGAKLTWRVIRG